MPHPPCQNCNGVMTPRYHETKTTYGRRKYCSYECVQEGRKRFTIRVSQALPVVKGRTCPACDKLLVRRANESNANFGERSYCNQACYKANARRWSNGLEGMH